MRTISLTKMLKQKSHVFETGVSSICLKGRHIHILKPFCIRSSLYSIAQI